MLKFWLRMGFVPPVHLYGKIQKEVIEAETFQEQLITNLSDEWLQEGLIEIKDGKTFSHAFTGIIMAVMVEIVYFNASERLEEKLDALWSVFWRGIQ